MNVDSVSVKASLDSMDDHLCSFGNYEVRKDKDAKNLTPDDISEKKVSELS